MKIKIRYENGYQTLEVETEEVERWSNISISEDEVKRITKRKSKMKSRFNLIDQITTVGISMTVILAMLI